MTAENIKKMYEIEKKFFTFKDYGDFCKATSNTNLNCDPNSWLSFAKNFESSISTVTQTQIDSKLSSISSNIAEYYQNNFFFDKSFSQTNTKTKTIRAMFLFANPIDHNGKRYKTFNDHELDQELAFVEFSKESRSKLINMDANFTIKFYSKIWYEGVIDELVAKDIQWLGASFTTVFLYVSFHLQSMFLASISMLGIGLSLPVTIFVNKYIFQITMFNFLNYIAIFVILGIAADDVFVFTDCWKQSATFKELKVHGETKHQWLLKRMNYTWRRTSKAILTTSLTT